MPQPSASRPQQVLVVLFVCSLEELGDIGVVGVGTGVPLRRPKLEELIAVPVLRPARLEVEGREPPRRRSRLPSIVVHRSAVIPDEAR